MPRKRLPNGIITSIAITMNLDTSTVRKKLKKGDQEAMLLLQDTIEKKLQELNEREVNKHKVDQLYELASKLKHKKGA